MTVSATADGVRIEVHVVPRASRPALAGLREGRLVVRVAAPPAEGAANDALRILLARTIGVPPGAVTIAAGLRSRRKTVAVRGTAVDVACRALGLGD